MWREKYYYTFSYELFVSVLKKEAACSSEGLLTIYQTTWHCISESISLEPDFATEAKWITWNPLYDRLKQSGIWSRASSWLTHFVKSGIEDIRWIRLRSFGDVLLTQGVLQRTFRVYDQRFSLFLEYCINDWRGGGDSSVCIATRYGLDGPRIESRWGARFSAPVQTGPGAYPSSCTMGTGYFPGESGWDVVMAPHPHLQCRGLKYGTAIPVPTLRALVAHKGGTFTFINNYHAFLFSY